MLSLLGMESELIKELNSDDWVDESAIRNANFTGLYIEEFP